MSNKRELQLETASGKPCAKKCLSEIGPSQPGHQKDVDAVAVTITITESSSTGGSGLSPSSPGPANSQGSADPPEPASASEPAEPQSPELPEGANQGLGADPAGLHHLSVASDDNGNRDGTADTAVETNPIDGAQTAEDGVAAPGTEGAPTNPASQKTCCFCWCCCCSCSW